jgi:hypothetical protein
MASFISLSFLAHASLEWHLLFLSYFCIAHTSLFGGFWREVNDISDGVFIVVDEKTCFCVTLGVRVSILFVGVLES